MNEGYSSQPFEEQYTYSGNDLGAVWSKTGTAFRLWSPVAEQVVLCLYPTGDPAVKKPQTEVLMKSDVKGTWVASVAGDLNGFYYTYRVSYQDKVYEACDPYAKAVGINGHRSMVIDLASTNPEGWESDCDPHADCAPTDAVIYEVHIRDISANRSSGIRHKGKFLGLTETDTHTRQGFSTGLKHIKELGITHVQLQPIFDFGSVDEADHENKEYNWGYDPMNYNAPEGSYSTDPTDGAVRVRELKAMIQALHHNGISVIMDVVYNHVYKTWDFCFNRLVHGYFSRIDSHGVVSGGSGCGNDTASERSMVHKYIVDSIRYWMEEYHIDGFRFDLVGLIDIATIQDCISVVRAQHPNALLYGEGWQMGTAVTKPNVALTTQWNSRMVPQFAFFSDTIRDTIRGSVFDVHQPGFASGAHWSKESLEKCFRGKPDWAQQPTQTINYVSCHDNHTLADRIQLTMPWIDREELAKRCRLAAAFTLLSQGIPLMLAGEELLRSKPGRGGKLMDNTYKAPDTVNSIKWLLKETPQVRETVDFYKGLIAIRKAFPFLRLTTAEDVEEAVSSIPCSNPRAIAFAVTCDGEQLVLGFNADTVPVHIDLPVWEWWSILVLDTRAGVEPIGYITEGADIPPLCAMVLYRKQKNL